MRSRRLVCSSRRCVVNTKAEHKSVITTVLVRRNGEETPADGDSQLGSGNPEGHAHSTDSVDFNGARYGREFGGSTGILKTLVHEYAHLGLGVGQGPPDYASSIADLCLGY
jgi:hypothetical protein